MKKTIFTLILSSLVFVSFSQEKILTGEYGKSDFIYKNGKIGIGTDTPVSPLSFGQEGSIYFPSKNGKSNYIMTDQTSNRFKIEGSEGLEFWTYYNGWGQRMVLQKNGDVGIGTTDTKGFKLAVKGKIGSEEIQVNAPGYWPDYVFASDYKLKSLDEVETYIEQNNHLPDIPSEKEVKEKGINLGDMNAKLLQKIEELMLYTIQQQKEIEKLKEKIELLDEK